MKRWLVHVLLELRCYSDLSRHIKEPQNDIYRLNFLKNENIWKLRPCFIPEVTCFVFSRRAVRFLFAPQCIFLLREDTMCSVRAALSVLSDIATVIKEGEFLQRVHYIMSENNVPSN